MLNNEIYTTSGNSIHERIILWRHAMNLLMNNYIWGVDAGNYGSSLGFSQEAFPHFSGLHIIAELGVVGLCIYLIILLLTINNLFIIIRAEYIHFPVVMMFICGLVFSVFHRNYFTDKYIYFVIGYVSSFVYSKKY